MTAHDLGSALTAIPGETDMSISPWSHMQNKLKIPDRLYWANLKGEKNNMFLFVMIAHSQQQEYSFVEPL